MKRILAVVVGLLAVGAAWVPRDAFALGPVDLELAVSPLGGGTSTVGSGTVNPLGYGIGARAGIDVFGLYAGVAAMYYFGDGGDVPDPSGDVIHTYGSSTLVGLEGGYNLGISILTLRPQLGVGYYNAGFTFTDTNPGLGVPGKSSTSTSSIYLEPDITGLLSFGMWFVGADVGVLWVPAVDDSQAAVTAHAQVGIKL
jgi:hypothetical protein